MKPIMKLIGIIAFVLILSGCDYYVEPYTEDAPHPFAIALEEHIQGYDGVVRAFLVTLDDYGTIGVMTARTPEKLLYDYDLQLYVYVPPVTLFFIQDGNVHQLETTWIFASGRYYRLMDRLYGHTHMVEHIYVLEDGRLQIATRLEYFTDEYLMYLFENDYEAVAGIITHRDSFREKDGLPIPPLPNPWVMENVQEQNSEILALTINCVPRLVH